MQSNHLLAEGLRWHQTGQLDKALAAYRQALALDPNQPEALDLLGLALHQSGQSRQGAECIAKAIQLNSGEPSYFNHLGLVVRALGQIPIAQQAYQQALRLAPQYADAWYNLGNLQQQQGCWPEALHSYKQAHQLQGEAPDLLNNLGVVHQHLQHWEEAEHCFRRALQLTPGRAEVHSNLGTLLENLSRFEEAVQHSEQAVRLEPRQASHWVNLASTLQGRKQLDPAAAAYRHALQLEPDNVTAHMNLAMLLLEQGDFRAGWREHEWRLKHPHHSSPHRTLPQPRWDGSPLAGRTVLVHTEQGLGDTLQFVRFVPRLAEQGGQVLLECQPPLVRLLSRLPGVSQVLPWGSPLPPFDCHIPLMSLPALFDVTLESLPRSVPYVTVPSASHEARTPAKDARLKVGLCWSSNVQSKNHSSRVVTLQALQPLLELAGCEFFSFQMGAPAAELAALPPELRPTDLTSHFQDLADTAHYVADMDLVITVDTVMAHLAGAMNVPVWVLLAFNSDWRWLLERTDSPWYPSMTLFRQRHPGHWDEVIQRVRTELEARSARSLA